MSDLAKRIAGLSPEKHALLTAMLQRRNVDRNGRGAISRRAGPGPTALSFGQQQLWLLNQLDPESPSYNMPVALRLHGSLDAAALSRALREVVHRHESLRTTFRAVDGQPMQIVASSTKLDLGITDIGDLPVEEREREALRLATIEARTPFDLVDGPLIRAKLLRLSLDEHVFLLATHHIVSDGWSCGILVREIARLYDAFSHDRPSPLPELPIQYADYAAWQREWLHGEALDKHLEYWSDALRGAPALLDLPTDHPRPAVQSFRGASRALTLPRSLADRLNDLSRQEGATLFMTLLAAFDVLVHRYSGQDDVLVGTPVANRTRGETEDLIGFFVNTLVLRADLSGNPSFRQLLVQVRERALGAYAHQDVPFEMVVDALQPERDLSHNPLFQVMFALQNTPMAALELPGLRVSTLGADRGVAKFDLTLNLSESPDGLAGSVEYCTDLFDADTIDRMIGHLATLLEGIAADPDRPISDLPILSVSDRTEILHQWNNTTAEFPRDRCLHQLFEEQAARSPDSVAVIHQDENLTCRELNVRSNRLAHHLQALGVGPETIVGICVERSVEMIVGILGILKAGAAYLPLDPNYPAERLAYMLEDSRSPVVLTQKHLEAVLPTDGARVLRLDADWPAIADNPDTIPTSNATPSNLAYVIYTSGSTGRPKGVLIEHRSAVNLLSALVASIPIYRTSKQLRVSLNAPFTFDASVKQIVTLLNGHTLCILPQETRADARALLRYLHRTRLDVLDCVPTQIRLLIEVGLLDKPSLIPPVILLGGEAIDTNLWASLAGIDEIEAYDVYGPTECTVDSTICRVKAIPSKPCIGRPLHNVRLYVLDKYLQPVPIGVPGELYIGGVGVARGYLNRPDLTAERFLPDPFRDEPDARIYRTGDLVRYLPDGNVEFLGRIDHQVKIRGFRVELGEIESALAQHHAVQDAVVLAREDRPGDKRLVAYCVSSNGPLDPTDLRSFLKNRLPDYMLPSAFVPLDSLPLTPNGKLDRKALPAPDNDLRSPGANFIPPATPTELLLANIWRQLLGIQNVSLTDGFFELGGHSLLATQLVSRVRETFDIDLPLRTIFESPTLGGLARQIDAAHQTESGLDVPPIRPTSRDRSLPLSFAQQRLWFLDQLEPGSPLYNIAAALRLSGDLRLDVLYRSLDEIVRRHESLRTTFHSVDGQPVQVISPDARLDPPLVDLSDLPEEQREAEALRLATEEAQAPFDLAQGPLVRAKLLRLSPDEHFLLFTLHHAISDGWSMGVLVREAASLYDAFSHDLPSPLPGLPVQYADYAAWQREWLHGEALDKHLEYWSDALRGAPALLDLPTDHPRPAVQSFRGATRTVTLPSTLADRLTDLGRQEGATLFMTILAAFDVLLARYSGQSDVLVGTPIANRTRGETEGLIGFFVNTLVLRADLSENLTFRQLLAQVRERALGAYAHQDLPFEMIVDALQPERDLSHNPLFQVMLVLQNTPRTSLELPDLTIDALASDTGISTFDLTLSVSEQSDGLRANFEYCTDLFEASTIERLIEHFVTLLKGVIANPDHPVLDLQILSPEERKMLLVAWNETATPFPAQHCVHQLFEEQAERSPDSVAIVREDESLTYRELNVRSNRLAHHLQALGAGPETIVGICVERSVEMIVGILGILKAGAAYLPLDPSYPAERLAYMLEDSRSPIVLTQKHLEAVLPTDGARILRLDADWPAIADNPDSIPTSDATPSNLAYVIYTSGSTGKPKGVLVPHSAVVNHNIAVIGAFGLTPADRVLQFANISFDTAVEEIFPTLLAGATLVLRPAGPILGSSDLLLLIQRERLTFLDLPTAYWHAWSADLVESGSSLPPSLRLVVVGGEAALWDRLSMWQQAAGTHVRWLNTYGPTEGTVIASLYEPSKSPRSAGAARPSNGSGVPIGRPIANARLYVLDSHRQPVPIGVPGELYIGGAGVARGYLNRPDLNAERFLPDPFSDDPNARMYRTGDLVRYLPDGNVEFLGRIDHQVKIRGFRVELGEIESALAQHHAVQDAVVLAREDRPGDKRLVAYCVSANGPLDPTDLRSFLKSRLPDYMLPSAFVPLGSLPVTPNGKVDRRALPVPDVEHRSLGEGLAPPATPTELLLANIWQQVLGVRSVGIHDNFFELGGDSILTIQIISRARQAGLRFSVRDLFQHPTIAEIATLSGSVAPVLAEQGPVTGPVELTPIQRWFFAQEIPNRHHWNQAVLLSTTDRPERAALEAAVRALLAHHDALRLRFAEGAGGWKQFGAEPDDDSPVRWLDLSALSPEEQRVRIEQTATSFQASLDLSAGPIFAAAAFDLGRGGGRLLLVAHHLAVDGISWRVLLEDLQTAYAQAQSGETTHLPPKTTSFQTWARRLKQYATSDEARREIGYWLDAAGGSTRRLPVDHPEGPDTEKATAVVTVRLSEEETRSLLQDVPAAYGTEINDVLLCALGDVIGRWAGGSVRVDLEGHGREELFSDVDLSRTVGWFTTVYPVRLGGETGSLGDRLKAVKEHLRRVPRHGIGYGILRYLGDEEETARCLGKLKADVSFNYLGQFDAVLGSLEGFKLASESVGASHDPEGRRGYRLDVTGAVVNRQLQFEWTYGENVYDRETVQSIAKRYGEALRDIISHCLSPDTQNGYTPSDFPEADLDQADIEALMSELGLGGPSDNRR